VTGRSHRQNVVRWRQVRPTRPGPADPHVSTWHSLWRERDPRGSALGLLAEKLIRLSSVKLGFASVAHLENGGLPKKTLRNGVGFTCPSSL
jgi:hypothetical protein